MMNATDPQVIAVLVCDQVIQDAYTGKKSFIGVFDNMMAPNVPCICPELNVVVVLTGCRGTKKIILEMVVDTDAGEKIVMGLEGNLQSDDPLKMVDLIFKLRQFPITDFGKYTLRVSAGDSKNVISHRPFRVTKLGGPI
jgi:hypothetical protein